MSFAQSAKSWHGFVKMLYERSVIFEITSMQSNNMKFHGVQAGLHT